MKLPEAKTALVFVLIALGIGVLFTLVAVLTCESPDWEVSPLGFVRLHCADSATWTGFLFSRARWWLSFNLYLCIAWPVIILIAALARWLKGKS